MRSFKKIMLVITITLVTVLTLNALMSSANAESNLSCQVFISANNRGVAQQATYTFTINNTGTANLGGANITVPFGYLNIKNPAVTEQPPSQTWSINNQDSTRLLLTGSSQGLTTGQSLTFTFDATNPQVAGNYLWTIGASQNATAESLNSPEVTVNVNYLLFITSALPVLAILGIAAGIAFLNSGINRVLINYFVGWEQYRVMQKEMAEYRSETMKAARANDKKQIEKLKKKDSQIKNMQSKMVKPQIVQFGISFVYLIVWFLLLTPTFQNISMAYVPGFGPIPVFYWYPICSLFFGLISSRIIGIMPIET